MQNRLAGRMLGVTDPDNVFFVKEKNVFYISVLDGDRYIAINHKGQIFHKLTPDYGYSRIGDRLNSEEHARILSHIEDLIEMPIGDFTHHKINYMNQSELDKYDGIMDYLISWANLGVKNGRSFYYSASHYQTLAKKVTASGKSQLNNIRKNYPIIFDIEADTGGIFKNFAGTGPVKKRSLKGKTVDPKVKPWMKFNKSDFTKRK